MENGSVSSAVVYSDRLQDGLYFRKDERPGRCYRLLLLNVNADTTPSEARRAIATVWTMLQDLRRGVVRELQEPGWAELKIPVPHGRLTCLLGFGARLFNQHEPRLVSQDKSAGLAELPFLDGSEEGPFPSLHWAVQEERGNDIGETDLAIQCIADTELAVNRAAVEVWKLIDDEQLPLEIVASYSGFNRDDQRSWLGFYDGISNIRSDERQAVIEVVSKDPPWLEGGTYMAFLRIAVDLAKWRSVLHVHQEILVGRNKLTGCPLESVNAELPETLVPVPLVADLLGGTPPDSLEYRDPPRPVEPLLQISHMHRANVNRDGRAGDEQNNRIFRQGYEFLDAFANGRPRLGLNFVSFQRRLSQLTNILQTRGWLRDVNFGGPESPEPGQPSPPSFLSVRAGGFYAVPPRADLSAREEFPGAGIFA